MTAFLGGKFFKASGFICKIRFTSEKFLIIFSVNSVEDIVSASHLVRTSLMFRDNLLGGVFGWGSLGAGDGEVPMSGKLWKDVFILFQSTTESSRSEVPDGLNVEGVELKKQIIEFVNLFLRGVRVWHWMEYYFIWKEKIIKTHFCIFRN